MIGYNAWTDYQDEIVIVIEYRDLIEVDYEKMKEMMKRDWE